MAKKEGEQITETGLTPSYLIRMIFSWLSILYGAANMIRSLLGGFLLILAGIFISPPIKEMLKEKFKIKLNSWLIFLIFFMLAVIGVILISTGSILSISTTSEKNAYGFLGLFIYVAIFVIYFLPTIFAYRFNHKKNADAIFLLNLFLGWTFIGWIIALIWSATKD